MEPRNRKQTKNAEIINMNFSKSLILSSAFLSLTTIGGAATLSVWPPVNATVINVGGTFSDGAVLSGSFDITNGQISSADMQV